MSDKNEPKKARDHREAMAAAMKELGLNVPDGLTASDATMSGLAIAISPDGLTNESIASLADLFGDMMESAGPLTAPIIAKDILVAVTTALVGTMVTKLPSAMREQAFAEYNPQSFLQMCSEAVPDEEWIRERFLASQEVAETLSEDDFDKLLALGATDGGHATSPDDDEPDSLADTIEGDETTLDNPDV